MKRLVHLVSLALIGMLVLVPAAGAQQGQAVTVSIQDFFFEPAQLAVEPGTTVTWVNEGQAPHTATATDPAGVFDSGTLQTGQSFSFTFTNPGTFAYFCAIHPNMTASVTVGDGSSATQPLPATGGFSFLLPAALALAVGGILALVLLRRRVS